MIFLYEGRYASVRIHARKLIMSDSRPHRRASISIMALMVASPVDPVDIRVLPLKSTIIEFPATASGRSLEKVLPKFGEIKYALFSSARHLQII